MREGCLYVGLDVSNTKIDVAFLDCDTRPVRSPSTYPNGPKGWTELRTAVVAAARLVGPKARVVCGMESTSNMHKRLEQALRAETRRKLEVHVLNSRAAKSFGKVLLKDAKTDRLDSRLIALSLLRMQPQLRAEMPAGFDELKEATRTRRRLVEERTDHKNRPHKLLRCHLPGYCQVLGIRTFPKRLLVVLAELDSPHALPKVTRLLTETTARRILDLDTLLAEVDRAIEEQLEEVFPGQVLTSIPGIGKVSAATLLAEIGDIARFESKEQFVGY